ncbi:MAG: Xaa-Pro dipeptidase, partial [Parasporobacterium sp.]|nr:Xaa-Pro dipeptidase [Parasporobacterium sp.]
DELFCAMGEKNIAWVPTVSTVGNLIGSGTEGHGNDATLKLIFESQKAAIKKAAARGVKIASGSDAGAANVPHVKGALTEYKWLKEALGDEAEDIVAAGNELIRGKF